MTVAECVKCAMAWRGVGPEYTTKLLDEAKRWMNATFDACSLDEVRKRGILFYHGSLEMFLMSEAKDEHKNLLWFRPGDIVQPIGDYANGCYGKWKYGIVEGYRHTTDHTYCDTWDLVVNIGPGKKTVVESANNKKLKIASIPPELLQLAASKCPLLNGGCNGK